MLALSVADERTALLRAVVEDPGDVASRLVYSDWLDDHGEGERAEFIRVQCELAEMHTEEDCGCSDCRKRQALRRREQDLLLHLWGIGQLTQGLPGVQFLTHRDNERLLAMSVKGRLLQLQFRRGFVEVVSCTLADWCGGMCTKCGGNGELGLNGQIVICPVCHGTGRVGGHGPAVVMTQPIRKVRLTDKFPEQHSHVGGVNYSWYSMGFNDDRATIPVEVLDCLKGGRPGLSAHRIAYDTEANAQVALSAGLVIWARGRAGLPPWRPR
jgi:uncharacterized protein (TIGR02996 family)